MPVDNVPTHSPDAVDLIILERSYIPLYVPHYSPEPNPIEAIWKVLKGRVKRYELISAKTLPSRVIEGSEDVSVEHIQDFIQYSIDVFPKCFNKEPL